MASTGDAPAVPLHNDEAPRAPAAEGGAGAAVELAPLPAVDAAPLLAQAALPQPQPQPSAAALAPASSSSSKPAPIDADAKPAQGEQPLGSPQAGAVHLSTEYLQYLEVLSRSWTDCPSVEVSFDHLSYALRNESTIADARVAHAGQVRRAKTGVDENAAEATGVVVAPTAAEENTPNLAKAVGALVTAPVRLAQAAFRAATGVKPDPEEILHALAPCSGVIRPGSMTLILAPPGAGKSVLLRALSGRLSHDSGLTGKLLYNGLTQAECKKRGIYVTRLASYVGQNDIQFPVLSVEETLQFAKDNGVADVSLLNPDEQLRALDSKRTELLMDMLGLTECRSTAIGSDLMRGVSGGQKKRAQLGETLMSNARLYALDEVSNGLDSAVTLHIFSALRQACAVNHSSVITALQQVTPETYALFDSVILMREGHVLYHGPRDGIRAWLRDVMLVPYIPDSLEEAGFLVDLLSDPKQAMEKAALAHKVAVAQEQGRKPSPAPRAAAAEISTQQGPLPSVSESRSEGVEGVVRFHLGDEDESAASPQAGGQGKGKGQVLAVPIVSAAMVPFVGASSGSGSGSGADAASAAAGGPVSAASQGVAPFKLDADELASLQELDRLLDTNERSDYTVERRSRVAEALRGAKDLAAKSMDVAHWSPYTRSQYGQQFPHSTLRHTRLSCQRQVKLLGRNLTMVVPRIFNSVLMGLVYGTLFFQLPQSDFASRLGIIQNAVMFMAFANFQELPVAAEARNVVVRQVNAGFYPSLAYTFAVNMLTLPLALTEAIVFGILVYFIPGFELDAGRFFFFLFLLLSVSSAMSLTFRTVTYLAANADVAQQLNMPFVMLFVVYGGFLIPRSSIQDWLIWAYYLSPFSWATDALAVNEFSAGTYGAPDGPGGQRIGDAYLDAFGLRSQKIWQWAAIAYLWGFYLVLSWVSALLLAHLTPVNPMGTKRAQRASAGAHRRALNAGNDNANADANADNANGSNGQVRIEVTRAASLAKANGASNGTGADASALAPPEKRLGGGAKSSAKASFQLSSLPFAPATLSWQDLKYTVYVGKEKTPKVLLNHISGYAEPGKLTALMGSSGAGKTTLLDVLAGRKTTGLIEHENNIFVNGAAKNPATFKSITGYVEQNDIHNGQATVREALDFSAKLRLPTSVDTPTREAFVSEVMQLIGLTGVANRMIGDVSQPSLSTGQLKLLTIGVELVANPSILFLDEPTSGLDSKSAFRVMKAIRRIAATGRTIVCTIHQPSQEVFFMFDRLLLLRRGGETVYFDDIGQQGDKLVDYLTRASRSLIPWSPLVSPANWMLDVVGLDATQLVEEHREAREAAEKEAAERQAKEHKLAARPSSAASASAVPAATGTGSAGASVVAVAAGSNGAASEGAEEADQALQRAFRRKLLAAAKSSAGAKASFHLGAGDAELVDSSPIQFSEVWKQSPEFAISQTTTDRLSTAVPGGDAASAQAASQQYVNGFVRLQWVVARAFRSHWRSPPVNLTRCILLSIIGIFLGIVYYQLRVVDYAGMSSLIAAVFLGVSLPSSICSNASLAFFFRQRAVFYRESSVGMYGYMLYTATMTIVELPYMMLGLLFFLLPFYFMVGLSLNAGLFFQFLLASYLMCVFFHAMEQLWVAALPSIVVAQALNGLMMSLLFAFGGLYIKASSIPVGWQWFYYMDPIPKSFIATMLTQVWCPEGGVSTGDARIDGCRTIDVPNEGVRQLYGYVRELLEGAHHQYWWMIGYLCLTIVVARIFSLIAFKKISHIER